MFSQEFKQELDQITNKYEQKRAALLPLLHRIQEKEGLVTPEAENNLAEYLGVPVVHIHEVVCFYHLFRQEKIGRCHFSICQTTACALRGAEDIIGHIEKRLNIKPGETTPDGKFTLNVVECLGACEIAPVLQLNDNEYKGLLNTKAIDELIDKSR